MNEYEDSNGKEWLVYINANEFNINMTDEEFIDKAQQCGDIYSLKGFQEAFNEEKVNTNNGVIRILYV